MAKTTHASAASMAVADLLNELNIKVDEATRCLEMLNRINSLERDERVDPAILSFIDNYAVSTTIAPTNEGFSVQFGVGTNGGFIDTVSATLKKIFNAIWEAIKWICEKIKTFFRYIFDSQFRSRKSILDIQQRIIVLSANADIVTKFERTNCSVIKKSDVDDVIFKTQELVGMMASIGSLAESANGNVDYASTLATQYCDRAGVKVTTDNKVDEALADKTPVPNTTFSAADWSVQNVLMSISQYLGMLNGIDTLKNTKSKLEKEISALKDEVTKVSQEDCSAEKVNKLQKMTAAKIQATKLLGYSIAIAIRRSDNILAFFTAIYNEMHKIH